MTPDETIRDRLRMLVAVDEGLGRIMDALEKQGVLDKTVVILVGDNGYFYGEHGLSEERRLAYEESIRLPLLMRYPPSIRAGSTPAGQALTIDIAPTILDLAAATPLAGIDGRSLVPLFSAAGTPAGWRQSFLVEYTTDIVFPRTLKMGYDAVRNDRYKFIRYRELDGMNELYDLEQDPYELRNLIDSPSSDRPAAPDGRRAGRVAVGQAAGPEVTRAKPSRCPPASRSPRRLRPAWRSSDDLPPERFHAS